MTTDPQDLTGIETEDITHKLTEQQALEIFTIANKWIPRDPNRIGMGAYNHLLQNFLNSGWEYYKLLLRDYFEFKGWEHRLGDYWEITVWPRPKPISFSELRQKHNTTSIDSILECSESNGYFLYDYHSLDKKIDPKIIVLHSGTGFYFEDWTHKYTKLVYHLLNSSEIQAIYADQVQSDKIYDCVDTYALSTAHPLSLNEDPPQTPHPRRLYEIPIIANDHKESIITRRKVFHWMNKENPKVISPIIHKSPGYEHAFIVALGKGHEYFHSMKKKCDTIKNSLLQTEHQSILQLMAGRLFFWEDIIPNALKENNIPYIFLAPKECSAGGLMQKYHRY